MLEDAPPPPHTQENRLEDYYALKKSEISNEKAAKLKKMAAEFRKQLTIGLPNT
ncbi:MAG: hypothetical protein LBK73_02525 [Treponema sp.]|jgi:hypothetical protein|nr:hypothetical protein [Treponema sp.]